MAQSKYKIICKNVDCGKEFELLIADHARMYCTKECRIKAFIKINNMNRTVKTEDLKVNNRRKQLLLSKAAREGHAYLNACFSFDKADCY